MEHGLCAGVRVVSKATSCVRHAITNAKIHNIAPMRIQHQCRPKKHFPFEQRMAILGPARNKNS
jgi:hypothetical protein